ncbi:unnamed protein product [Anisakis simplex]|uniref:C2 domain-containing protein n=1 Tax=Anisakis simplex TaxID=6269 RepID=A0A0M3J4Y9_ANISI|nr:unnamed protein product [Anisakis simplex]
MFSRDVDLFVAHQYYCCFQGSRVVEPYVKMYLLPERRNHCKTRICKKSVDPEFNEMFSFDVAFNNLPTRMLQFTVYDFDRFTRHDLIGNVIMRDLFDKSDLYNWTEYTMQIVGSQVWPISCSKVHSPNPSVIS